MATVNLNGAPTGGGRLRCCWPAVIRLRPAWLASVAYRSLFKGCCLARLGLSSVVVVRRRPRHRQHQSPRTFKLKESRVGQIKFEKEFMLEKTVFVNMHVSVNPLLNKKTKQSNLGKARGDHAEEDKVANK